MLKPGLKPGRFNDLMIWLICLGDVCQLPTSSVTIPCVLYRERKRNLKEASWRDGVQLISRDITIADRCVDPYLSILSVPSTWSYYFRVCWWYCTVQGWWVLIWAIDQYYSETCWSGCLIIETPVYCMHKIIVQMLYCINWTGKSGHLYNQDTYDWFQGVHNTQLVHCIC